MHTALSRDALSPDRACCEQSCLWSLSDKWQTESVSDLDAPETESVLDSRTFSCTLPRACFVP